MYRNRLGGFILGVLITTFFFMGPWIQADTLKKSIDVLYTGMPIFINEEKISFENHPFLYNDWTFVSIRELVEKLGKEIYYNPVKREIHIFEEGEAPKEIQKEFTFENVSIGYHEDTVKKYLGAPDRIDESKYGFGWYIYNHDYKKYLQVGIQNGKIVGFFTNADFWRSKKGIGVGTPKNIVHEIYGDPLVYIEKKGIQYMLHNGTKEYDTYLIEDYYVTLFYSIEEQNTVIGIQVIDKKVEEELCGLYGEKSKELETSYANQLFDMINSLRARKGLQYLTWDEKAAELARIHSIEMAQNNYFSYKDIRGKFPQERFEDVDIDSSQVAENIAAGYTSPPFVFEGWINSPEHAKRMVGDFEKIGVGVYLGGKYKTYYTQDVYRE